MSQTLVYANLKVLMQKLSVNSPFCLLFLFVLQNVVFANRCVSGIVGDDATVSVESFH